MEEPCIERMKSEEAELQDRTLKLIAFMESDEFGKLDDTEKRLMRMQYAAMDAYLSALGTRLVYEEMKRYQHEIQALGNQIPDLQAQGKTDEEIAKILAEKSMSITDFSFDLLHNMLPMLAHGQMLCGENSEQTAAK